MKLHEFLKSLSEEWVESYKDFGETIEVFSNPSKKEFEEAKGDGSGLRFIADDKKKKLFIFSEFTNHTTAAKQLGYPDLEGLLFGVLEKKGNTWELDMDEMEDSGDVPREFDESWKWLDKYFDTSPIFELIKDPMLNY